MAAQPSVRRRIARKLLAAWVGGMALLAAPEAQAGDEEEIAIGTTLGVLGAVDIGFGIYDLVVLAEERNVSTGASTAQLITVGVQTNALHIAIIALAQEKHDDEDMAVFGLTFPTMLTSALTAQAAWSLARPDTDQGTIMLGSTVIGINEAYTIAALSHAVAGKVSPLPTAIGQIVTSMPTISLSAYKLSQPDPFRSGWLFLTAWSSAILLHGTISAFNQDEDGEWGSANPARRSVWNIEAAPTLTMTPDPSGQPVPFVGIAGRL